MKLTYHRNRACEILPTLRCTYEMSREGKGPSKEVRKGWALTEGRRGDQTQGPRVRRDTRKEADHEGRRAMGEAGRRSQGGSQPGKGAAGSSHRAPHHHHWETADQQVLGEVPTSVCPNKLRFSSEDSSVDAKFSSGSELCRSGNRRPTMGLEDPSATSLSRSSSDDSKSPASLATILEL